MSGARFAEYAPRVSSMLQGAEPPDIRIRIARRSDVDPVAIILRERNGGRVSDYVARLNAPFSLTHNGDQLHLVAEVSGHVVGYGQTRSFERPEGAPANAAPAGWYLSGVNIRRSFRRQGIAKRLTQCRLDWLTSRTHDVYYFANSQNKASIDLHASFGFVEVTRDFWFPGVGFRGGVGILFRLTLNRASGTATTQHESRGSGPDPIFESLTAAWD